MQHDFILLDRSGSMAGPKWTECIGSINGYVKDLADKDVDTGVTLAVFDSNGYDVIRERIIPKTWLPVATDECPPRGGTPLNDSIAKIVAQAKAGNYDKCAILIVTDGEENMSREVTGPQAKALLDEIRAKGWQVTMLGAQYDNLAQATSLGNQRGQTMNVAAGSMRDTVSAYAGKRGLYGATGQSIDFSEDEKDALNQKKDK